jgi:drug/metabolite transporter (DMT)-like permease
MEMIQLSLVKKANFGYYLVIIAAALSALIHVVSKPMLDSGNNQMEINPIVMTFLVYFICGVFFTPLARKTRTISKFTKKDITFMLLIGIAEVFALITYFYGLGESTAVNASIFSNSEVIFSLVIAMLVFREKLHIKEYIPFSMIVIGMMLIPIGSDLYQHNFELTSPVIGDFLIIFSGLLFAIDITLCKYVGDRFDVKRIAQIVSFIGAIITISIIGLFQIPFDVDLTQLPGIFIISILGTGISTIFFLMGLRLIGAVRTVLLYSTTSVFGVAFAGIILGEIITIADILSLSLVLGGIFFLRYRLVEAKPIETRIIQTTEQPSAKHTSDDLYLILDQKTIALLKSIQINGLQSKLKTTYFQN